MHAQYIFQRACRLRSSRQAVLSALATSLRVDGWGAVAIPPRTSRAPRFPSRSSRQALPGMTFGRLAQVVSHSSSRTGRGARPRALRLEVAAERDHSPTSAEAAPIGPSGAPPRAPAVCARVSGRSAIQNAKRAPRVGTRVRLLVTENQFAKKIDSISLRTFSSVWARAIAISFTIRVRAVSSMRRSPKESCLLALRR